MIKIRIHIEDDFGAVPSATAEIPSEFGPALRSALDELQNTIGERLVGVHPFEREDALTAAATALAPLRAAVNKVVPQADPHYEG